MTQFVPAAPAPAVDRPNLRGPRASTAAGPRRSRWAPAGGRSSVARSTIEALEGRRLLSVAVAKPIDNTFALPGASPTDIDLAGTFDDVDVAGPVVRLDTSLGNVDVELFDKAAPKTSQNFANYVANNLYNQTVIHRLVKSFVLQGGGYLPSGAHIQQGPPVKNEFSADRPNLRGTIAMAKIPDTVPGGGPDSATSEWFINLVDNPGLDADNGGFTVFGQVINGTMSTVDAIANLPLVPDESPVNQVFDEAPLRNALDSGATPTNDDFVFVNSAAVIPDTRFLTLAATSDNPAAVNPVVANGVLRLNYGSAGSARITVTATDSAGNAASQTFVAGVGEIQVQIGAGGVGQSVSFTEADGGRGTVSISKGGAALVRFGGNDLVLNAARRPSLGGGVTRVSGITTLDTGTNTTLTVSTKGGSDGLVDVGGVTSSTPLKALSMKSARLTGTTTIGGTVRTLTVGALNDATVTLGGDPSDGIQLAVALGTATDSSISSGMPIRSVKADEFLATGDEIGTITAPAVTSVTTRGAFRQAINAPAGAIKSIKVGGPQRGDITADSLGSLSAAALEGGLWTFSQAFAPNRNAVGKVTVRGSITGTTIRSAGNVGSVSAGSVVSGRVYAGANVTDEELPPFLPAGLGQFTSPARIASVKVAGETAQFSLAATALGKLTLGQVQTDEPISFGLAATQIESLVGRTADTEEVPSVPFSFRRLEDQASFDAQAAALQLPLGNFEVRLF